MSLITKENFVKLHIDLITVADPESLIDKAQYDFQINYATSLWDKFETDPASRNNIFVNYMLEYVKRVNQESTLATVN